MFDFRVSLQFCLLLCESQILRVVMLQIVFQNVAFCPLGLVFALHFLNIVVDIGQQNLRPQNFIVIGKDILTVRHFTPTKRIFAANLYGSKDCHKIVVHLETICC